jgi:hypothetical protein
MDDAAAAQMRWQRRAKSRTFPAALSAIKNTADYLFDQCSKLTVFAITLFSERPACVLDVALGRDRDPNRSPSERTRFRLNRDYDWSPQKNRILD